MLEDIRELLKGTFLEDAMMMELEIPRTTDIAIAIAVNSENAIEAWKLLKSHISQTERYPVLATFWNKYSGSKSLSKFEAWQKAMIEEDLFSRFFFDGDYLEKLSPEEIIAREDLYTQNDLTQFLDSQDRNYAESFEERMNWELEDAKASFGNAPSEAEIKAAGIKTMVDLERYLLKWEQNLNLNPSLYYSYQDWCELDKTMPLILLPNPHSWNALAYMHWYGGSKNSIYLLKQWQEEYGAELVCLYGTVLQLFVERKPSSIEEAFELASQQIAMASWRFSKSGVSIRNHARALLNLDRWLLEDNPK